MREKKQGEVERERDRERKCRREKSDYQTTGETLLAHPFLSRGGSCENVNMSANVAV